MGGITQIRRVGFLQISARHLVEVREPSTESSQVIRGNIAGYLRNLRTVLAECSTEGLPQNARRETMIMPVVLQST